MKSLEIIKKSIKEINLQLKKKDKIVFDNDFQILGPKSSLDSLIIVNLFVAIEEKLSAKILFVSIMGYFLKLLHRSKQFLR